MLRWIARIRASIPSGGDATIVLIRERIRTYIVSKVWIAAAATNVLFKIIQENKSPINNLYERRRQKAK